MPVVNGLQCCDESIEATQCSWSLGLDPEFVQWMKRMHRRQLLAWKGRTMEERQAPCEEWIKKKCLDKKKKSVYRYDIGLPRIISQGMRSPKTCLYWLNQILHPYISFSLLCLEKGMVEHHNHPRERLVVGCFIARLAGQWLSIQMDVNEKYITTI